jgi:TonB family protein
MKTTFLLFAIFVSFCTRSTFANDFLISKHLGVVAHMVRPEYPYMARAKKITGCCLVRFKVSAAGRIEKLELAPGTGSPILDNAAISACREWQFKPGSVNGWARCPICFTMSGAHY